MEFSRKLEKKLTSSFQEAGDALKKFDWQGNVRELRNVIEQGVLLSKGAELALQDLSLGWSGKERIWQMNVQPILSPPVTSRD